MSKNRTITMTKLPNRACPVCGEQVQKAIRYGQLSYICDLHWGPWDDATPINHTQSLPETR